MVEADVVAAAQGVSLVVHGANPPGYRNWAGLQLPMLNAAIAAAKAADARLVFPGTVYNYGPDAFPNLTEDLAAAPDDPQGRDPGADGRGAEGRVRGRPAGADRPRRRLLRPEDHRQQLAGRRAW